MAKPDGSGALRLRVDREGVFVPGWIYTALTNEGYKMGYEDGYADGELAARKDNAADALDRACTILEQRQRIRELEERLQAAAPAKQQRARR